MLERTENRPSDELILAASVTCAWVADRTLLSGQPIAVLWRLAAFHHFHVPKSAQIDGFWIIVTLAVLLDVERR